MRTLLGAAAALMLVSTAYVLESTDADLTQYLIAGVLTLAGLMLGFLAWERAGLAFQRLERAAHSITRGEETPIDEMPIAEAQSAAAALDALADGVSAQIAAAQLENEQLSAALNSSTDAVIAVDADGRVTFANRAAESLFGRPGPEMTSNPFVWIMPDEHVIEAVRASREEGHSGTTEIERNRQFLRVITSPIVGGGAWATLVVIQDLSDVKRVEQVRRDFVANVSHELRTPLAALKAVVETLEAGALDDPAVARDFLGRADTEIERLVQMVEELLELSRIESGEVPLADDELDLNVVVSNAVERLRRQAERGGLALTLELPSTPVPLRGDPVRLERAVLNLVHNAVKFTPSGGQVNVLASVHDSEVSVVVRDTGIGIDAEDLPRVFERFYKTDRSRRAGGTGLGLAVVKHTVEAHGGRVWAESEQEKGSTFGFALPLGDPAIDRRDAGPKL